MHDAAYYIDLLLSGVTVGSLYALIAIGYTMVYGILRLINFAHGDIFMMAGFFMVYAATWMPMAVCIPLVLIATVALGVLIEKAAYSPLRTAPRMSVMISAIGVSYLLQNLATYITGGLPQMYPALPGLSNQRHPVPDPGDAGGQSECQTYHHYHPHFDYLAGGGVGHSYPED